MLTTMLKFIVQAFRNQRGVVSVEWIILAAVIMSVIVLAFLPTFTTALTNAVTSIGTALQTQITAAGS